MLEWVNALPQWVTAISVVVTAASVIVAAVPRQPDDSVLGWVLKVVQYVALHVGNAGTH